MLKVGIIGASGYTGLELIRILSSHPDVELTLLTSQRYEGQEISSLVPVLIKKKTFYFEKLSIDKVCQNCDLVFAALPHKLSMNVVPRLLKENIKVIDLSADYRLNDAGIYKKWYQAEHTSPHLLKEAVYGLPEINKQLIRKAKFIASPGCYPTSAILGLAPMLKSDCIDLKTIIIDSKSGVSGAGRKLADNFLFAECNENIKAYSISSHRHLPEIEQELTRIADQSVKISFTPHLIPMTRGLLSTIYVNLDHRLEFEELREIFIKFYEDDPFVMVAAKDRFVDTKSVNGANTCHISLNIDPSTNRLIIVSAIDNLVKGSSGQAVQCMNILSGFEETKALLHSPLYP